MAARRPLPWNRQRLLHILQQALEDHGWPRLQMMLVADGPTPPTSLDIPLPASSNASSSWSDDLPSVGDADGFTIPLVVLALAAGLALSSLYIV